MRKKSTSQETRDLQSAGMETEGSAVTGRRATRRKTPSLRWLAEQWKRKERKNEKWSWTWRKTQKEHKKPSPTFKTAPFAGKAVRRRRKERKLEKHTHPRIGLVLHGSVEKRERWNKMKKLWGGGVAEWWVGEERKMKKKTMVNGGRRAPRERERRKWSRFF